MSQKVELFGRGFVGMRPDPPKLVPDAVAAVRRPSSEPVLLVLRRIDFLHHETVLPHLWSPFKRDFSSLVDRCGWREKMPRLERSGVSVGTFALQLDDGTSTAMTVHNGVHDSNAALSFYVMLGYTSFSLISTGTWVVLFNTDAPLSVLDKDRDMLANVTVDQVPVVTARFMGGREYDLISQNARVPITINDIESAISKGQMALPSFAAGGPFPDQTGCLSGPPPADERARAAIATLYLACMTAITLDLVQARNTIIIDGGLANNPIYPQLVAALRQNQTVLLNVDAEGTSAGAASLAFETFMGSPFTDPCIVCQSVAIEGLHAYFTEWRARTAHPSILERDTKPQSPG